MLKIIINGRNFCSQSKKVVSKMKYLNVAEKNDAAKNIAGLLSNGSSTRREGLSKFNKIYQFAGTVQGRQCDMIMTSVSGHLLTHEFSIAYSNWQAVDPLTLFSAPVSKRCPTNFQQIKNTLEKEIRGCSGLIIWTDCDREGENIGFEIIDVCRAIKPNLQVYRAIFSEITSAAVKRALANLKEPDIRKSQAVDVRSELDLRIGAAFTRYQTMRYQRLFPSSIEKQLVSYGSCQIPTLGFVAQRFKENENFVPQAFWKLIMNHKINDLTVEFLWNRNRLFDKQCCEAFLMVCQANPKATVTSVTLKSKSKWRPLPLDTVELEKLGSRKLKITAKQTMTIAEKLYQQGFISYPRTETNKFSADVNLTSLVEQHTRNPNYGSFATKVLEWGPNPRSGTKSDQAHPPIHPTKYTDSLTGNEGRVYELIVRHFLACVSRDAVGSETIVNVEIVDEEFTATGLIIHERNYLEVYIYDKWNAKEIHSYEQGQQFDPTELAMKEGKTTPPSMLTEAELIALMDKHGIGTDATHAEHINTIKERTYIGEINGGFLVPGQLGMGLVEGYQSVDLPLAEPKLRAGLEKDLQRICDGSKDPAAVLSEQIQIYKDVFQKILQRSQTIDATIANRLQVQPADGPEPQATNQYEEVQKCPRCGSIMTLRTINDRIMLTCLAYPNCSNTMWFPQDYFREAAVTNEECFNCGPGFKKIKFKLRGLHLVSFLNVNNVEGLSYVTCVACDRNLKDLCALDNVRQSNVNSTLNNRGNNVTVVADSPRSNGDYINPNARNKRSHNLTNNASRSRSNDTHAGGTNNQGTAQSRARNPDDANNRNSRPSDSNATSSNSSTEIKCPTCGKVLNPLTVRAETANKGRQFYKCCQYFKFADEMATPSASASTRTVQGVAGGSGASSRTNTTTNDRPSGDNADEVKCLVCGQPAKLLTVTKDSENKGRQFYNCPRNCKFFQWADESARSSAPTASSHSSTTNRPSTSSHSSTSSRPITSSRPSTSTDHGTSNDPSRPRATRKCGICRQEGHNRLNCPRK